MVSPKNSIPDHSESHQGKYKFDYNKYQGEEIEINEGNEQEDKNYFSKKPIEN